MDTLLDKIRRGDRRSLARAMSLVDEGTDAAQSLQDSLRHCTGQIPWWGFTGPPGVGKSTLIDALLDTLRQRGQRVGVVAVDPTSPLSEGALLGDRVRMMRHAVDQDVFIRSLATHHCEGGLSDAALHCARLLELARYDPVLIETVGVGQSEADIASVADICVVILGPGYGDDIQLIKAGLLEIADIVAVNKCDLPGAKRLLEEVRAELGTRRREPVHKPADNPAEAGHSSSTAAVDIVGIEAKSGKGVGALLEMLLGLDRTARGPEQRRRQQGRRILGEIRRHAMLVYERALERWLTTQDAEQLIVKLERDKLSLDEVINRQFSTVSKNLRRQQLKTEN